MKVEVSNGELVDKAMILKVKMDCIIDQDKLRNIEKEYEYLTQCLTELGINETSDIFKRLYDIHRENWGLIEIWNRKDYEGVYDEEYIEVTKKSNRCNRERFYLKTLLNSSSALVEEKSDIYGNYKTKKSD